MTKVSFYILRQADHSSRLDFCRRLAVKAARSGMPVYIALNDTKAIDELSENLWSTEPESFIAHDTEQDSLNSKITLGLGQDAGEHEGLFINLTDQLPNCFSQFERAAELVIQDPEVLKGTRERYGLYRHKGYPLETHQIN